MQDQNVFGVGAFSCGRVIEAAGLHGIAVNDDEFIVHDPELIVQPDRHAGLAQQVDLRASGMTVRAAVHHRFDIDAARMRLDQRRRDGRGREIIGRQVNFPAGTRDRFDTSAVAPWPGEKAVSMNEAAAAAGRDGAGALARPAK